MTKSWIYILTILLLAGIFDSCNHVTSKSKENDEDSAQDKSISHSKTNERKHEIKLYNYDTTGISEFFLNIITNHFDDFYKIDSNDISKICDNLSIDQNDMGNNRKYVTISALHKIFTSKSAANCSRGDILNIPYQWHWITPNPRHKILFTKTNTLLKNQKPPSDFSKYNSFADIDRTPYLYLSDLVHSEQQYFSNSCDSFSTFGWCSEREMAFVALTSLLKFEGKVVAESNHSWTEILLPLKLRDGTIQYFLVVVDNTFDNMSWTTIDEPDINSWRKDLGNTKIGAWYNQKARSKTELERIKNHKVPTNSASRIEKAIVRYLNEKINKR